MEVNYKSDFKIKLRLSNCLGEDIGIPNFNWRVEIFSGFKVNTYKASYAGGLYTNAYADIKDGHVWIVCQDHSLSPGQVTLEFIADIPDSTYPSGHKSVAIICKTGMTLANLPDDSMTCCAYLTQADICLPVCKTTANEQEPYVIVAPEICWIERKWNEETGQYDEIQHLLSEELLSPEYKEKLDALLRLGFTSIGEGLNVTDETLDVNVLSQEEIKEIVKK
ncbi:MAG: hypothetical protein NC344_10275 [Bacteroidales bacterium]|nr:hypothetical protein [Bacteroidales bacterium]MCM1148190.1 hypothetical protein [Bacteroidales bacterium]MCM1207083.1 hypothetical protein [Bacillota bacterium]MCM1510827.1 hypothetical protein [Clostridium sp.]